MIEAGVGWGVMEGAGVPGFGIRCRVDKAGETACVGGPGAHGAWFQGGVEGTACKAPASDGCRCATDGEEFGVGGGIPCSLTLVGCYGQDLPSSGDYGADRNLALLGGILSGEQGTAHHGDVGLGVILYRWRHEADDSSLTFADFATDGAGVGSLAVSCQFAFDVGSDPIPHVPKRQQALFVAAGGLRRVREGPVQAFSCSREDRT
jgi:hypothetical protein